MTMIPFGHPFKAEGDAAWRRDLAARHAKTCECARCVGCRIRTFVWCKKMHLPTSVRHALRDITIRVDDSGLHETDDGKILQGQFSGTPNGVGTITIFAEAIRRSPDVPSGAWHSGVRRVFRHEVAHAIGAGHPWIDAQGDLNG